MWEKLPASIEEQRVIMAAMCCSHQVSTGSGTTTASPLELSSTATTGRWISTRTTAAARLPSAAPKSSPTAITTGKSRWPPPSTEPTWWVLCQLRPAMEDHWKAETACWSALLCPFFCWDGGNRDVGGESEQVQLHLRKPAGPRRRQLGTLLHRSESPAEHPDTAFTVRGIFGKLDAWVEKT